jgi:hypothetical protein
MREFAANGDLNSIINYANINFIGRPDIGM